MDATIHEAGNGLPVAGDYVPGNDGNLYLVLSVGRIETGRSPGAGDWCTAEVEDADWDDCDEGDEFPAEVRIQSQTGNPHEDGADREAPCEDD